MKEYQFKCSKCGADLGGGAARPGGSTSINVKTGLDLSELASTLGVPLPDIRIDVDVEVREGRTLGEIPSVNAKAKDGSDIPTSMTFMGKCPKCGEEFVRQVRPG